MKNLSRENIIILSVLFLLFYSSYLFGVKKTFTTYNEFKKEQLRSNELKNASLNLSLWERKNSIYDSILRDNEFSSNDSFNSNLFKKINKLSAHNTIEILDYSSPILATENQSKVFTFPITFKGRFKNILKTLHQIEMLRIGKIQSIQFQKRKNHKTNKYFLVCKFYYQVIKKDI